MVCFLSLSGLLIVVHVFTNLEEFIEYGHTRGSLIRGLVEYYGPYMLGIFDRMSGVLTMMAVMFVVAWLARTNELTAILAAGISKGRVVKPIIYASLGILALSVVNRELLIPRFADSLGKSPQDLAGSRQLPMRPMFDQDQEILIGGRHLMSGTGSIEEPVFRLEGPSIVIGKQISAVSATYQSANENHPNGYLMDQIRSPSDISEKDSVRVGDRSFVLTAKDNAWLKPNQCFVVSDIPWDLLEGGNSWKQYASTYLLIHRLRMDSRYYGADVRVAIHSRFVRPFIDAAFLFLALPLVLSRQDRNLFWVAGMAIVLIAFSMIVVLGCQSLGAAGSIPPMAAAWLPLLVFLPLGWAKAKFAMES